MSPRVFQQAGSRAYEDEDEHRGRGVSQVPPQHFARVSSVIPLFLYSADVTRVPGPSGWADEGERTGGAPVPGPPGSQARLREDVGAVPNHCGKAKIQMERGTVFFFFFFGSPVRKLQNHNKR